jgi:hypothetical protein
MKLYGGSVVCSRLKYEDEWSAAEAAARADV